MTNIITPADDGVLAVTIDDCRAQGLGDDDTVVALENQCRQLDLNVEVAARYYADHVRRSR